MNSPRENSQNQHLHEAETNRERLKIEISRIIEEIKNKISNLDLEKFGIDKFRIAFDLEGVLVNINTGESLPFANYILREFHESLNENPNINAEILIWTSAIKIYVNELLQINESIEIPENMEIIYRKDNTKALDNAKIPHTETKTGPFRTISKFFNSTSDQNDRNTIISDHKKIPTLHNVHALIDDNASNHIDACVKANFAHAGNFILEGLNFGEEDSLIKALEKLSSHISKIPNYF